MPRTGPRRCAYCKQPLEAGRRSDAEYCDSSCRARGSEKRKATQPTRRKQLSAQKRSRARQTRRSTDLRISYRKAVEVVAVVIQKRSPSISYDRARELAVDELAQLLTDKQKAAL